MDLFPFINLIFSNPEQAKKVSNTVKARHAFMLNRFCSIEYPIQAALLSNTKIPQHFVTDFWINFLSIKYGVSTYPPKFFFTKTKKEKNTQEKSENVVINNDDLQRYKKYKGYTQKQIDSAIEMFGVSGLYKEIEEFKEISGMYTKN